MSAPADRPRWEQHPLLLNRARLEAISQLMWLEIQKVMFPGQPRRTLHSGRAELTVVGGTSCEDVVAEAVVALLRYEPANEVRSWEALGVKIARLRAVDAVREATKGRHLPGGSEISVTSLDLENQDGERVFDNVAAPDDPMDDQIVEQILRLDQLLAIHRVAEELPDRDREIVFRVTRGETNVAIAQDVGLTPQRVGQIHRESLRKINARLRDDPKFRTLHEPEGGNPHD